MCLHLHAFIEKNHLSHNVSFIDVFLVFGWERKKNKNNPPNHHNQFLVLNGTEFVQNN